MDEHKVWTKDEIRYRLRTILYTDQVPITRLAKDIGMDAITVDKAVKGEMTDRTVMRFTKFFNLQDRGFRPRNIEENSTVRPLGMNKRQVIRQLYKLYFKRKELYQKLMPPKEVLEAETLDELARRYFEVERQMKKQLLEDAQNLIEQFGLFLFDKWDYWQWEEKVFMTARDTAEQGTSRHG